MLGIASRITWAMCAQKNVLEFFSQRNNLNVQHFTVRLYYLLHYYYCTTIYCTIYCTNILLYHFTVLCQYLYSESIAASKQFDSSIIDL